MEVRVCKSCGRGEGGKVLEALGDLATATGCLNVCSKACGVMVRAPDKPTYVFGNLTPEDAPDIERFCQQYTEAIAGDVNWTHRPEALKNTLIAKLPP